MNNEQSVNTQTLEYVAGTLSFCHLELLKINKTWAEMALYVATDIYIELTKRKGISQK